MPLRDRKKLLIGVIMKKKEKEKKKDNQYKLKKAMAIAIGLILSLPGYIKQLPLGKWHILDLVILPGFAVYCSTLPVTYHY